MPGFNTIPVTGGGGGQPNMSYVGSVHMVTYNRTWNQGGTAGYYAMYSTNQENGYVYFVGATTTGGPLNRLINVNHSFTSINIIAPQNDMCTLYKAKVKSTTTFANPFTGFASFPSVIDSSGNFVLPNNALPLVNSIVHGGGGGGGNNRAGGGGGGGVVKLTAFQAVGTTAIVIGGGGGNGTRGSVGGTTFFGNVYALGGCGGAHHNHRGGGAGNDHGNQNGVNGGGAGGHSSGHVGGTGTVQTANTGLGLSGSPVAIGGFKGGDSGNSSSANECGGGGGAGAGGNGEQGHHYGGSGTGGAAHIDNDIAPGYSWGAGGYGGWYNSHGSWGSHSGSWRGHGGQGGHHNHDGGGGASGRVLVRYYIP